MAELILTEEEKASALWSDLSDESLGRLVKKKMAAIEQVAQQMDVAITYSAALLLCCAAGEADATSMDISLGGVTQAGREFGDWVIRVEKAKNKMP